MTSRYIDDLKELQKSMLDSLSQLDNGTSDETGSPEGPSTLTECSRLVVQFGTVLRCAVVSLDQGNRHISVVYLPSKSLDDMDTLRITGNLERVPEQTRHEMQQLVQMANWLYEFKRALRCVTEKNNSNRLERIDQLRDEAIGVNTMDKSGNASDGDSHTVDIAAASTKTQLLNQTKKLTSNLMKGNQILQSGILQSDLNLDELKQQTNLLQTVDDKYDQFQSVMQRTSTLVKTLEKASNREKRDVYIALIFLVACISWVFWRRILRMPTKLLLWICFKFFKSILATVGLVRSTVASPGSSSTVSSAVQATTATLEQAVDEAMDRILAHDEL